MLFPDVLVCNAVTLRRIDEEADPKNIRSTVDGRSPSGPVRLTRFRGDGYVLELSESDDLRDNQIAMLWIGDRGCSDLPLEDTPSIEE